MNQAYLFARAGDGSEGNAYRPALPSGVSTWSAWCHEGDARFLVATPDTIVGETALTSAEVDAECAKRGLNRNDCGLGET